MGRLISLETLVMQKFDRRISRGTLRNWISQGAFPFIRIGGRVLFDEEEVDAWIEEKRKESVALRSQRHARITQRN